MYEGRDQLMSQTPSAVTPIKISSQRSAEDRAFRGIARGAGLGTFLILFLIGLFLLIEAIPAFRSQGFRFFTNTGWQTSGAHPTFGVLSALTGSIIISIIGLVVAIPISLATALFINEYAPTKVLGFVPVKNFLTAAVDLMAAVPSIIYGMWGFFVLQPHTTGLEQWLATYFSFIPIFKGALHVKLLDLWGHRWHYVHAHHHLAVP